MTIDKRKSSAGLALQLGFLKEVDQLKCILRQSPLLNLSRNENSAEHSWHLAMYAMTLADYANCDIELSRVIKMLLIHDIVEIDAGDTPIHSSQNTGQAQREAVAAKRLFGILPQAQGEEYMSLWEEFESAESADSKFAKALDRFQPLMVNVSVGGGTWKQNNVTYEQVLERYGPAIERGSSELWKYAQTLVAELFAGSMKISSGQREAVPRPDA